MTIVEAVLPSRAALTFNSIHVVHVRLDTPLDGAMDLLDETERTRAARFVFDSDRRRFIVAHAWVRLVLGSYLACPAQSLQFAADPRGKPHVEGASADVRFNLSHTADRALIALTVGREVGVDIEQYRSIEILTLAERFFARAEVSALRALAPDEQLGAFFRCWTRKEAFVKALGHGLSFPLDQFEVSLTEKDGPQLLRSCTAAHDLPQQWRIVSLATESGYAAALAATAGDWEAVTWYA